MKLSVVIPVHNSEQYIDECLSSILRQTMSEYEIILVENGSIDYSAAICKRYAERFEFIKYIQLGNVGVSVARNEGIKAARGEWITFLDSDDCLLPNALSIFQECIREETEILLTGYSNKMEQKEVKTEDLNPKNISPDLLACGVLQFGKYRKEIQRETAIDSYNNWACWSKYFRRSFLIKNKIQFPEGIRLSEDTAFCFQAYCRAKNIMAIKQKTYFYRINQLSVSRRFDTGLPENNQQLLTFFESYKDSWKKKEDYKRELNAFYVVKVIELCRSCFNISKYPMKIEKCADWLEKLCDGIPIKNALYHTSYINLMPGKKNSISCAVTLFFLKRKMYKTAIKINIH